MVYSSDLIGTCETAAKVAAAFINLARSESQHPALDLSQAEDYLVQALAELRAARWGIERRMPNFDEVDLKILLAEEERAIRQARGYIPESSTKRALDAKVSEELAEAARELAGQ